VLRTVLFVAVLTVSSASGALADETGAVAPSPAPVVVTVTGATHHSGEYTLAAGARLWDALAAAGMKRSSESADFPVGDLAAMIAAADLQRVFLSRTVDGRRVTYQIDVTHARRDVRYDPLLRTGDAIYVPALGATRVKVIAPLEPPNGV
jgi:hypothetical protein